MPKTILLADDSVTIQKVVGISFANEDVVLLTVDNGDDAVMRARADRPDLVLADIAMPGQDGYAVCEAIKSDASLRHVPVLLLSGTFETFDEERARQVGADGHITKPFEAQALVDRVNDLLARAEAERPVGGNETTVLVSAQPSAGDAFEFFDDELAATRPPTWNAAPPPASGPDASNSATTVLVLREDDEIPGSIEPAMDALDMDGGADDFDPVGEPMAVASFEDDAPGDGHATMLFDGGSPVTPPPVPSSDAAFGITRSSRTPLVAEPGLDDGATRVVSHDAGDPLDFGFEPEEVPASSSASVRDTEAVEAPFDDPSDDLFENDLAPEPLAAPPPLPQPAATRSEPAPAGSSAHLEVLRGELRQHLEKVAWEAFGDLSERIVRETVARVEAVAWEVIPQMAEALIKEEIRKIQGEE
jgi:CheY-like chemotaxis protein